MGRLAPFPPPIPLKTKERHLFTVKIVQAQNLPPNDSSSKLDTFVTLSDENGYRLAKTRTIYDTLEPRCMFLSLRNISACSDSDSSQGHMNTISPHTVD